MKRVVIQAVCTCGCGMVTTWVGDTLPEAEGDRSLLLSVARDEGGKALRLSGGTFELQGTVAYEPAF